MGDIYASGASSGYPASLDTATTQTNQGGLTHTASAAMASKINNIASAIISLETAIGITPYLSKVKGLAGTNNSGTPNTQYDFSADEVVLRGGSQNGFVVQLNTGTITNNVSTAGPAANGRDQAGAFSASSYIHFYFIWGQGQSLATVSSATAPPTGPTLPANYTHWAYIAGIRFNGSSQIIRTRVRGQWVTLDVGSDGSVLSGGSATSETSIDLSGVVPPNAGDVLVASRVTTTVAADAVEYRLLTGSDIFIHYSTVLSTLDTVMIIFANVGQAVFYLWSTAATGRSATVLVMGYSVPNGA